MSEITEITDQMEGHGVPPMLAGLLAAELIMIGRDAERYRIGLELKRQAEESNVVRLAG